MINGGVINVLDYGATGNGTTDDTAAIQAAIDAASYLLPSTTGKPNAVFFPKGTYKTTATLNCTNTRVAGTLSRDSLKLFGCATWGSTIVGSPGKDYAILDCSGSQQFTMQDLQLSGVTGSCGVGIFTSSSTILNESHTQRFINIYVDAPNDVTANGGNGTVGFWNFGSEENLHIGCHYGGNIAAVFSGQSNLPFTYLHPVNTPLSSHSCGVNTFQNVSLYPSPVSGSVGLYTCDVNQFNFTGYISGGNESDGVAHRVQGGFNGSINATFETFKNATQVFGYIIGSNFDFLGSVSSSTIDPLILILEGGNIANSDIKAYLLSGSRSLLGLSSNSQTVLTASYLLNSTFKTNLTQTQTLASSEYSGTRLQMLLANSNAISIYCADNEYHLNNGKITAKIPSTVTATAVSGNTTKAITLGSVALPTSSATGQYGTACVVTFDGFVRSANFPSSPATSNSFAVKIKASFPFLTNASSGAVSYGTQAGVIESTLFENNSEFNITAIALSGATITAGFVQYTLTLTCTCTATTTIYVTGEVSVSQSPTVSSTQLIFTV
jgi:hypothetical protein